MDRLACDRMFVTVMELGSFAAAARKLGTSSGQASKLVSSLESELGVRLLNRTTRALSPTEAGQAYCERMRAVLEDIDAAEQAARSTSASPRGRLRVTAPLTFGVARLRFALGAFARQYPDISLDVQFSDRLVNLVDEGFDVAVRVGRPADSSLIARRLCDARLVLVASPAYLAARPPVTRPGDLSAQDCIIDTNFRDPLIWRFAGHDGPVAVPVAGRLRFSNAEACLGAAEDGLGIANVPDFVAQDSLRQGRVVEVLPGAGDAPMGVFVLYPPGRHLAAKVRAFIDFMSAHFSRGAAAARNG